MMKLKIILPLLILFAAGAIFLLISRPPEVSETEPEPLPPRTVETIIVHPDTLTLQIESQGFVRPRLQTRLSSEISGRVVAMSDRFFVGEFVRQGEILIHLEDADYQTALSRARAQVAQQALVLAEEEALAEQAKVDWGRLNDSPASALTLRKPQLENARANLAAAQADLAQAERDLERTKIRAPFDALVGNREVAQGQYVSPGTEIGLLYATDSAEIRLPLLANDLRFIDLPVATDGVSDGARVQIYDPASDGSAHSEARLIRSENVIDSEDRVLYAVARVEDPYNRFMEPNRPALRIGSFVTAYLESRPLEKVFRLPRIALRGDAQLALVTEDNTIEIRDINVVYLDGEYVYIDSGLAEGDRVCLTSPQTLYSGTRVAWAQEE